MSGIVVKLFGTYLHVKTDAGNPNHVQYGSHQSGFHGVERVHESDLLKDQANQKLNLQLQLAPPLKQPKPQPLAVGYLDAGRGLDTLNPTTNGGIHCQREGSLDRGDHSDDKKTTVPVSVLRCTTEPPESVYSEKPKPISDGCRWRKYGQKKSGRQRYPKAYYRCITSEDCPVKKRVQRSAENPSVLNIKYIGNHNHPVGPMP